MLKPKISKPEQGFTLIEVLIAIVIATIFVAVTMQVMALATAFRVRAQEYAEATAWIQEDLEKVKFEASQFGIKPVESMRASNDPSTPHNDKDLINIPNHGFSDGKPIAFQGEGIAGRLETSKLYYVVINPSVPESTNNFKVTDTVGGAEINLTSDSSGNLIAVAAGRCGTTTTPATPETGYADGLRDLITGSDESTNTNTVTNPQLNSEKDDSPRRASGVHIPSKVFTNRKFRLQRIITIPNTAPYNVLQLDYKVNPILADGTTVDETKIIAEFHTEVIPDAALQCPKN